MSTEEPVEISPSTETNEVNDTKEVNVVESKDTSVTIRVTESPDM